MVWSDVVTAKAMAYLRLSVGGWYEYGVAMLWCVSTYGLIRY